MDDVARKMPEKWFQGSTISATMCFIIDKGEGQVRTAPLAEGERQLGWFVLPPFQRPPVWTREQQISFIESAWAGLPLGVYIWNRLVFNSPYENWLLDGQQRITAILEYVGDAFPVHGFRYSELTGADQRQFSISTAFPCVQTAIDDEEKLRDIYHRLAYGGTPHDAAYLQELNQ